ncbi:MAG: biotin--[acetyl-CoA-carboxylase] ligase [Dehalococcoidia bacterium]|jgi:BirA family transcriptional regulator, biotin operon repressor / biotin---[acetyl-CoA-carboxylase] ligase|nr:biotin--[acetyl-CoA-carboxylase] ligase [Dehalococcoidia bacterium]
MKEVFIGNKIYMFEELTSTMDLSKEMILKDIEEGTTIIANNQSKGRGSNDRKWVSYGEDALFSIILKPLSTNLNLLSIITSYSIMKVLEKIITNDIKIKWPNDVLVDGKKISGVLIENYIKTNNYSIIGVGININSSHKNNDTFIYPSTSIKDVLGKEISKFSIIKLFLNRFQKDYNDLINNKIKISEISNNLFRLGELTSFRSNYKNLKKKSMNEKYKIISLNLDGSLKVLNNKNDEINISSSEIIFD